ncbi:MAG: PDZ domain-containing protein, partial [Gammaproteobacteria bacterium]
NSGGALINAHGELIGINTAIYSRSGGSQGIGFAIPSYQAADVMKQIIEHGHVQRGWLGIEAQDLTRELAETFGLSDTHGMLVAGVLRGGPADQAGIEPGDVIDRVDGHDVASAHSAMSHIAKAGPETRLELKGIRDGKRFTVTAVTGTRPEGR